VRAAWVYESGWSQLTSQGGQNVLVPGTPRFGGLSEAEMAVVLQEVLARRGGRAVVIYELSQPVLPALTLDPAPQSYRITTLGVQYGLEGEGGLLATSASSFGPVWALVVGNILPRPAQPEVNFSQRSIAAFFVGQKPTGGYGVRFVSANLSGGTWRVTVELLQPAPGAILTQALTSPYLVLELPGPASRVEFVDASGRLLSAATAR
jgi:hypothetical protein